MWGSKLSRVYELIFHEQKKKKKKKIFSPRLAWGNNILFSFKKMNFLKTPKCSFLFSFDSDQMDKKNLEEKLILLIICWKMILKLGNL